MEYGKKTSEYFDIVFGAMEGMIMPILDENQKDKDKANDSQNAMMNSILGLEGPKSVGHDNSPEEDFIANKLFKPMSEILTSLDAIENIFVYASNFPYEDQGVSRTAYLKYHVENYLNELYLLKNRLIAYLQKISRAYKKADISKHVSNTTAPVFKVVSGGLKAYIEVRGAHVHQNRYSDDDFDRLSSLELLSRGKDEFGSIMSNLLDGAYTEISDKWAEKIKSDLEGIRKLFEYFFEQLLMAITKDGELIFPSNIKNV